jgi:hypothetical protein
MLPHVWMPACGSSLSHEWTPAWQLVFDRESGRWVSGLHQHQELVLQRGDVSSDLCQVELLVLLTKAGLDLFRSAFVGQDALVVGLGGVVAFGDLSAAAVLLEGFLLG